jgi:hypothetical protein
MTTFVTAFITNVNSHRTIDAYIEYSNHFLTIYDYIFYKYMFVNNRRLKC